MCHNIILTDYNRFILLSFGEVKADLTLFSSFDSTPSKAEFIELETRFAQLLGEFFHTSAQIAQKDELIKVLSTQSFYLSTAIFSTQNLAQNTDIEFKSAFEKSYQSFRNLESTDISEIEFCDILAQSIVYGAFVAHIESEIYEISQIPPEMFVALLPKHFIALREFIESSLPARNLPDCIAYALSNIIKTIALIDKPSIARSFQKEISEVSIYLYEDFLKAYDDLRGEQKRKEGGVFYTPEPIVNMIVRSINELLQKHFGKDFGSESVKVLDFATGTGSFLAKVFESILESQSEVFAKATIINKCFRDIYGFEMSFVPYIVAHLKLSQILRSKGFSEFSASQKFQVYLTNTLDLDATRQFQLQVPFDTLKNERDKSLELKHKENLLVILGNPPYNVKSKNKGKEILELLQSYKVGLNETKINLDDDYIKFIRFAQWKLLEQKQQQGIMGFITNNSYLYGRTHRKMRESLAKSFDEIYILNLHGDSTEDKNDKNVFDIRVGVCVSLFVKYKNSPSLAEGDKGGGYDSTKSTIDSTHPQTPSAREGASNPNLAQIHYFSTKDNEILRRADKFNLLNDIAHNGLDTIKWQTLNLDAPYFWFVPKDFSNAEYENFWALATNKAFGESKAIFENNNIGVKTAQDKVCIAFDRNTMKQIVSDFVNLERNEIATKYQIKDSTQWSIQKAKNEIIESVDCHESANADSRNDGVGNSSLRVSEANAAIHKNSPSLEEGDKGGGFSLSLRGEAEAIHNKIHKIAYRPFDIRYTFYSGKQGFLDRPAYKTMKYFIINENLGICFSKDCIKPYFDNAIISNTMADIHFNGDTYIAPLYLYPDELLQGEKVANFTRAFSEYKESHKVLRDKTPEQILAFIYANLYNPAYRAKYLEYLKIGFPRINFEVSQSRFEKLANLGQKLIDLHLMREIPNDKSIELKFRENANKENPSYTVEKPKYEAAQQKILLNKDLEIIGISAEVWDYTIGGYKVLEKWLKYRANDKRAQNTKNAQNGTNNDTIMLSQSDFNHILNTAKILKATLKIQSQLEEI